jgi:glycosyltransferase involved in cell wall biosynthesis
MPRVSVAVPVYNGAALLEESLACIAGQTMRDFEVILSDNGSSDATPEICARYAAQDSRFRHLRREETVPAVENFVIARNAASSPYFLWRAYDDLSDDNYLGVLADLLDSSPRAFLAVPNVRRDTSAGTKGRDFPYWIKPNATRLERLHHHMFGNSACWFYGMWRHSACVSILDDILMRYPDAWASDHLTIFACAIKDGIVGTGQTAFRQRVVHEVRDYVPRRKPTYTEMADQMSRFKSVCHALIETSDLSDADKTVVHGWIARYAYRRCHRRDRIWKAWFKHALFG